MKTFSLVLLVFAVACASSPNLDTERAAILQTDSAWLAAARARDVDSTASFWTEDARVIAPGQPPTIGRTAIHKMLTDGFADPTFSVTWETHDVIVSPSGDFAYSFGTNAFTVPNQVGGVDTLRGQGVVVWRKGADGRWRSAVDNWTPTAQ